MLIFVVLCVIVSAHPPRIDDADIENQIKVFMAEQMEHHRKTMNDFLKQEKDARQKMFQEEIDYRNKLLLEEEQVRRKRDTSESTTSKKYVYENAKGLFYCTTACCYQVFKLTIKQIVSSCKDLYLPISFELHNKNTNEKLQTEGHMDTDTGEIFDYQKTGEFCQYVKVYKINKQLYAVAMHEREPEVFHPDEINYNVWKYMLHRNSVGRGIIAFFNSYDYERDWIFLWQFAKVNNYF